ncbi:MAG: zinc-ribbon domain-containing protein [Myxococcota bacterium]
MIVTCESCKSRYKLDDAKITGRGAKITCPRCKHVFVVYAKTGGDAPRVSEGGRAEETPTVPPPKTTPRPAVTAPAMPGFSPEPPRPGEWDDEPTRIGQAAKHDPEPNGYEARFDRTDERPKASVPAPPAPAAAPGAPAPAAPASSKSDVAAAAAALDFRKVGVTTWKVKVKIGLIYDFSDIKTLRKYIQDGRVTPADVISWDGKTWKPIGEIPDLDAFFVEIYEKLAAQAQASPPPDPKPTPPPEPKAGPAATPTKTGGEPNQFRDPFEELKQRQRERLQARKASGTPAPAKKDEEAKPNMLPVAIGLVLLAAGAIGVSIWWNEVKKPPPKPETTLKAPEGQSVQELRDKLNKEIAESMKAGPEPGDTDAPKETRPGEELLVPRYQDRPPPQAVNGASEERVPVRRPETPTAPPQAPSQQGRDPTAADHESVAIDAARGGDWSTAAKAYGKAVALDPKNARLQLAYGDAQYRAGDATAAQPTLQKAAQLGARDAWKLLGHIAREQGDIPGANSAYTEYLKGNPKDRAEIERLMSGG